MIDQRVSVSVGLTAAQAKFVRVPLAKVYFPPDAGDFESPMAELGIFAIKIEKR